MAVTPVVSVAHESGVASQGTFAGDVPWTCRTLPSPQRLEASAVSLRRCAWHNCPQLVPQETRFCKAHAHAYERGRGTSAERGYGAAHRRERARWQAAMDSGVVPVCAKCNQPVLPSQAWDLGHTDDRKSWTGPEHRSCNRRDGQRKAVSHQERWR